MNVPPRFCWASTALSLIIQGCLGVSATGHSRNGGLTQEITNEYIQRRYAIENESECAGYRGLKFTEEEAKSVCCLKPTAAEFAAVIPRLAPGSAIIRSGGDVGPDPSPAYRWYEFTPEIVGDHLVVAKSVECNCHWARLSCRYVEVGGVFDVDPSQHFLLGPGVGRDEAFEAVRLYQEGKGQPSELLRTWGDPRNMRIAGVAAHVFENQYAMILHFRTEACSFEVPVRIEGTGTQRHLRILGPLEGGCV